MKKLILLPLIVLCLTGCGIYQQDVKISKEIDMNLVNFGMTQTEVEKAIGVKYSFLRDKYYTDRYVTRWGVSGEYKGKDFTRAYFFEFNTIGELSNWGWHNKKRQGLW